MARRRARPRPQRLSEEAARTPPTAPACTRASPPAAESLSTRLDETTAPGLAVGESSPIRSRAGFEGRETVEDIAATLESVYNTVAEETAQILRDIGIEPEHIVRGIKFAFAVADLDMVTILHMLGVDTDVIIQAMANALGISEDAAIALVCIALPFVGF